ncbi:MAG: DUF3299 domain-containing protein [Verrucomicrobiota bacterium]
MLTNFSGSLLLAISVSLISSTGFATEIRGKPIIVKKKVDSSEAVTNSIIAPTPAKTQKIGEYVEVGFDRLANFSFEMPEGLQPANSVNKATKSGDQIPADVKFFDQKKVALKGFMLPLKVDDGVVTEMLIMKDQSMCCYGAVPRINDWVSVKMKNGGVKSVMDQPVTLYGKLHVGEMLENGYLVGIYELDGDKMEEAQ